MATFQCFEDIDAWQEARELCKRAYEFTRRGEFAKNFKLRDQVRDASASIMSNIAEGFEREGNQEFANFLSIAKGSAGEIQSHFYVALDQKYVTDEEFSDIKKRADSIKRRLGGLMTYLRKSPVRGLKYKERDAVVSGGSTVNRKQ